MWERSRNRININIQNYHLNSKFESVGYFKALIFSEDYLSYPASFCRDSFVIPKEKFFSFVFYDRIIFFVLINAKVCI